jgi:signal transduction histidine kinase
VLDEAAEARLDQHARTALYRVAQEGLSNAVRHGGATRVTLELAGHEENVRLTVQDNGAGFDTRTPLQAYGTSGHYGLIGIHERIEVLGGRVRLQSGPEGTRLEVTLPAGPEAPVRHRGDGASSIVEAQILP